MESIENTLMNQIKGTVKVLHMTLHLLSILKSQINSEFQ